VGGLSGFCSSTAICPAEVLKVRLQADRGLVDMDSAIRSSSSKVHSSSSVALPASGIDLGGSVIAVARNLWREEGARGFFRGLPALWSRDVPFYVVFFASYTWYTDLAVRWHGVSSKSELPSWQFALGGGFAGSVGWTTVFPMDVIKSRVQIGTLKPGVPVLTAGMQLLRTEGLRNLTRGWSAAAVRGFPANGAMLLTVETVRKLLGGDEE